MITTNGLGFTPDGWQPNSFLGTSSVQWTWYVTPAHSGRLALLVEIQGLVLLPSGRETSGEKEFRHQESITVNAAPRTPLARLNSWLVSFAPYPLVLLLASTGGLAFAGRWVHKKFRRLTSHTKNSSSI